MMKYIFWGMTVQAALSAFLSYNGFTELTWEKQRNAAIIFFAFFVFQLIIECIVKWNAKPRQ